VAVLLSYQKTMRYLLLLLLIPLMAITLYSPAYAQTVVAPQSVITLRSNVPNEQWNTTLAYMYISSGFHNLTLVRFPAVGIVSNATMSINITAPPPVRPFIYRASSAYDSATVTYNTRPQEFNLVYSRLLTTTGVININITNAVNAAFPEPLTLSMSDGGFSYGPKSSIQMTYSLASQQPPTPLPTSTPAPTSTPSPTPTPVVADYTVDLPDNRQADIWLDMTFGEFATTVTLMLLLIPLVLLVFQNWGREISDRY
jgi:hypothetical protein